MGFISSALWIFTFVDSTVQYLSSITYDFSHEYYIFSKINPKIFYKWIKIA